MSEITVEDLRKVYDVPGGKEVAVDDINLTVPDTDFLTLLGPSGCGKTTTLRCIAGLESPTSGEVYYDDDRMTDILAQERDISMVFQEIALYPHMRCIDNIAYPLKVRGVPKGERYERAREVAAILEVEELIEKYPAELSGGQRQRIAIARAVVRQPRAFLMDEPMTGLDEKLKVRMRKELKRVVEETDQTVVYVTHSQEEAMMLSDWIAVMNVGEIEQLGTPNEVYEHPNNKFVATFVGMPEMNVWPAEVDRDVDEEVCRIEIGDDVIRLPIRDEASHSERKERTSWDQRSDEGIEVGFRPQALALTSPKEGDFTAILDLVEPMGENDLCYLDTALGELRVVEDDTSRLEENTRVGVQLNRTAGYVFDRHDGSTVARTGESQVSAVGDESTDRARTDD
ncbi:ABC transporter ATP-binding protein [Halorussus salinisoli]|uniref:ABC transporter ATP-binding protein n=1 Tax=Halorussus salinisoli TaxID=2558242 RepID=UPI001485171B|nr:ABC transporter ATP-binding protein [Halorussus salinisoli]